MTNSSCNPLVELDDNGSLVIDLSLVSDMVLQSIMSYKNVSRINDILIKDGKPSVELRCMVTFLAKISQFKLGVKTYRDVLLSDVMLPEAIEHFTLPRGVMVDVSKEEDCVNLMRPVKLVNGVDEFDFETYNRVISSIYGSQKKAVKWSKISAFDAAKPVNLVSDMRVINSAGLVLHETNPCEVCYPLKVDIMQPYVYSESIDRYVRSAIDYIIRNL